MRYECQPVAAPGVAGASPRDVAALFVLFSGFPKPRRRSNSVRRSVASRSPLAAFVERSFGGIWEPSHSPVLELCKQTQHNKKRLRRVVYRALRFFLPGGVLGITNYPPPGVLRITFLAELLRATLGMVGFSKLKTSLQLLLASGAPKILVQRYIVKQSRLLLKRTKHEQQQSPAERRQRQLRRKTHCEIRDAPYGTGLASLCGRYAPRFRALGIRSCPAFAGRRRGVA